MQQAATEQTESLQEYDIVVVGAGLVGAAFALQMARNFTARVDSDVRVGKIALLEARPMAEQAELFATVFDPQVVAVTAGSQQWLDTLGVWQASADRACPYHRMQVRDGEGTGCIEFDAAEVQRANLGHIVENSVLRASLMAAISAQANIDLYCPDVVASLQKDGAIITVNLQNGEQLNTPLVVAADGANSQIREQMGFELRTWGYEHTAITATLKTQKPHGFTARQWFAPSGPLAFLPLRATPQEDSAGGHYVSIVWSQTPQQAARLMALDEIAFCRELTLTSEGALGAIESVSERLQFPLTQRHGVDYVQAGVALIGDAAHTIHPLAGQGVNLGFSDARVLAEELERALEQGAGLGGLATLKRYQRRRKPDNLAMMATMEGFKRLFEREELPLRLLRNIGMSGLNRLAPLKNSLIRQAMGML
ncbi:MAG: UbiH/UbiF/VisC/COQ6 family ubiquinone biosynthesis hydroxylase [Gammaproteobacteria bacterium]|nr:UbiH/UbiF/VisC/COQ6 family ubiquinone biosynthesis hydroxylase [Gammaproteobacteria bacterium]MBQ0839185.1 UbiH/UbiF/VisC/COQ6 family ubiquinone biosynthesis hydroxylase [Gammaproteobacteria bacterium]